jgi:hypothetical protein
MSRLPVPGQDKGSWGSVLNDFLEVSHNADGTLAANSVSNTQLSTGVQSDISSKSSTNNPVFTGKVTTPDLRVTTGSGTALQVLTSDTSGNASWADPLVKSVQVNGWPVQTGAINLSVAQGLNPTSVKTSAYTAVGGDFIPVDATGGSVTISLPVTPLDQTRIGLALIATTGNNIVTFSTGGSDVLNKANGPTSSTVILVNQTVVLQYKQTGGIWYAHSNDVPLSQTDGRYLRSNGVTVTGTPSTGQSLVATNSTTATWSTPADGPVSVFSAPANAVLDENAYCAPGSSSVASTAGLYTQGMVGLTAVFIAGGAGGTTDIVSTVQSVTDSNHLILAATVPGATGNAQTLIIGTDISAALSTAFTNAGTTRNSLFIPAGTYLKLSSITVPSNVKVTGAGRQETTIIHASSTTSAFTGVDRTSIIFEDWTVRGPGQGIGTGSGINFTLSANPATFYPTFRRFSANKFGVDGIAIATPIVGTFDQVVIFNNGRHGFNLAGAGQAAGTSCHFEACFAAGNWAAGYYFKQMAYSNLSGCAADANGVAYYYDTCIGITESGCGSEETYNFNALGRTSFTPNGLSRYIFNSKVVMNSPYMIQNVGTACHITNLSKVVINDYYEGSPGNNDDVNSNPVASLKVDTGCSVIVNNYQNSTAMSLASGSTTLLPDAIPTASAASQQVLVATDQSLTANSTNTVLSVTLTPGRWHITGVVTLQQGAAAGNTDIRLLAGTATLTGGTASTIRAASANQPASGVLSSIVTVTAAGTVLLNAYPIAATTVKAATTAIGIAGATSLQAIPLTA